MEDEVLNIKIKFAENEFPLQVGKTQEKRYRDAANFVEKRIQLYRKKMPKKGMDTHLALVSLELAIELLKEKEDKSLVHGRIEKLIEKLKVNLKGSF